jgi:hypothetical protein
VGSWTHITVTYSAAKKYMELYVNGIPATSAMPSAVWTDYCASFEVGHYFDQGEEHGRFPGEIADVQVWRDTVLTPTEVADLSGTPGYYLFPSDGTQYVSAPTSGTWTWLADCGRFEFYEGKIYIQEGTTINSGASCTGTGQMTYYGPGGATTASVLTLQKDGNLVIYPNAASANAQTGALWSSGTSGNPGDVMFYQPDDNLVIYSNYGKVLWQSKTDN